MHKFVRNLLTEWRKLKLPFENEIFVVAVSGGADSVGLMLALHDLRERKKLQNRFVIAHFNHNLRGAESEKDAEFVKDLAQKFKFELALSKGNVSAEGNLEQNARAARYEFLSETVENLHAYAVLTAHTLNDQAETFLLNLIRGSGLQGLSGMKAVRFLDAETRRHGDAERKNELEQNITASPRHRVTASPLLVRPLLNWAKRSDTENFCRESEIEFRYDTMNEDLAFKRVRVRKILLPMLEEFNPKIVETLAKTADLLRQEAEIFEEEKERKGEKEIDFETSEISLKELRNLSKSTLYRILRKWLEARRGSLRQLELKHIEAIERLAFSRKSGKLVELPNGESVVKKEGKLTFEKRKVEKSG